VDLGVAEKEEADEETDSNQQGEGLKGVLCLVGQGSIAKGVQGYHDVAFLNETEGKYK
jgi:hypothetical protein